MLLQNLSPVTNTNSWWRSAQASEPWALFMISPVKTDNAFHSLVNVNRGVVDLASTTVWPDHNCMLQHITSCLSPWQCIYIPCQNWKYFSRPLSLKERRIRFLPHPIEYKNQLLPVFLSCKFLTCTWLGKDPGYVQSTKLYSNLIFQLRHANSAVVWIVPIFARSNHPCALTKWSCVWVGMVNSNTDNSKS